MQELIMVLIVAGFATLTIISTYKENKVLTTKEIQAATAYCESQGLSVKTHPNKKKEGYVNDVSCRDGHDNLYPAEY